MLRSGLCRALSSRSVQKPPAVSTATAPWAPAALLTPSEGPGGKESSHAGRPSLIPLRTACAALAEAVHCKRWALQRMHPRSLCLHSH